MSLHNITQGILLSRRMYILWIVKLLFQSAFGCASAISLTTRHLNVELGIQITSCIQHVCDACDTTFQTHFFRRYVVTHTSPHILRLANHAPAAYIVMYTYIVRPRSIQRSRRSWPVDSDDRGVITYWCPGYTVSLPTSRTQCARTVQPNNVLIAELPCRDIVPHRRLHYTVLW